MNRVTPIFEGPLVSGFRFDHPSDHVHHDPEFECATAWSFSLVERGEFDLQAGPERWRLKPGMGFLISPGTVYSCRHLEEYPSDVCLSMDYTPEFTSEILGCNGRKSSAAVSVFSPSNRLGYLQTLIAGSGLTTCLAAETFAGDLLTELVGGRMNFESKPCRPAQLHWYAERIDAARRVLETRFFEGHSLRNLSRSLGMSPYHFAHIFRELTGVPPHQYLLRVRLGQACARLRDGESVTRTCYEVGFANLSHFTRLFRRAYGISPSHFARSHKPESRES